jgi:hypothetical protein
MTHALDFYTSYNQFYIYDKNSEGNTGSVSFWNNVAHNDRLAIEEGILGVGTECYGPVRGELQIIEAANNEINLNDYDHIVEAGIRITSGTIQVLDCPDSNVEFEINVKPGSYRVRIYSSNLVSVVGDEGDDFYRIEIWPSNIMVRTVFKRYKLNTNLS